MNKSNDYSFILKFPSKSEFNIKLYLNEITFLFET